MKRIVYLSTATELFDRTYGLENILETSRRNNSRRGVSGALVFSGGNFLQLLEGPRAQIDELYAIIQKDVRHKDLLILHESYISEATSSGWWMANFNIDSQYTISNELRTELMDLVKHGVERQPGHAHSIFEAFILHLNKEEANKKGPGSSSPPGPS